MGKNKVAGSPLGKWHWLKEHPKRADLLAVVAGARAVIPANGVIPSGSLAPSELAEFGLTAEQARLVCWDALGVRARLARQSYRKIAEWVRPERSYETWRTVVRLYLEYSDDLFADAPGLKLGKRARESITPEVVRRWSTGRLPTADVAKLLGENVSSKHALYWIRRRAKAHGLGHLLAVKDAKRGTDAA